MATAAAACDASHHDVQPSSGPIGVQSFQSVPSTPHIANINTDKKMLKRIKKQLVQIGGQVPAGINLANGVMVSDVGDGAEGFFWRQFKRIAMISPNDPRDGQTGSHFIPIEWLSAQPGLVEPSLGLQKYQEAIANNLLTQGQKRKREEELDVYRGERPEKIFYEEAKKYADQTGHELVLFHGVHFSKPGQGEQESDFIMVDRTLGAVVATEVKTSLNNTHDTLQHAVNQVAEAKALMEAWFGDLLQSFYFIGTVFGETLEPGVSICPACQPFVFYGAGQILPKLLNLKDEMKKSGFAPATIALDYRELIKFMVFCIHANKDGAPVGGKMTKEVEDRVMKAGNVENIQYWSIWTPAQYGIMKSSALRFVLLPSSMATGKTELLVGKAIEKARAGEKVLFVIFGYAGLPTLKKRFKPHANIQLRYINVNYGNLKDSISELKILMEQLPDHHTMGDEMVLPKKQDLGKVAGDVDQLRKDVEKDTGVERLIWIALAGGLGFKPEDFTAAHLSPIFPHFYIAQFNYPLRGTKQVSTAAGNQKICNVAQFQSNIQLQMPSNLVEGIPPAVFTFKSAVAVEITEAVREAMCLVHREEGSRGVVLLLGSGALVSSFTNDAVVKGVEAVGRATPLLYVKNSSPPNTASEAQVEDWMEGGDKRVDLVADAEVCRGWEEKTVVVVELDKGSVAYGLENLMLRTISRLVIVKQEFKFKNFTTIP